MYTEAKRMEVLQKLSENGGNCKKTARETDVSRRTLGKWKVKYGQEYIEMKVEQQSKHVDAIFGVRVQALQVIEEKLQESSAAEAARIYHKLTVTELMLRGELVERHQVDVMIEAKIDIRAITDRTQERLQLLDELSRRGGSGLNSPPVQRGPDGASEVSGNRDAKRFVYHEQSQSEAIVVVEPDTIEAVPGD